ANGQLGTIASSRRFKENINEMGSSSDVLLKLRPVKFTYKRDSTHTPQWGLIAEEVADLNPDLVARDNDGSIFTVRYEQINAMLLNEFLKEHAKVETLTAQLKSQDERLQSQ